MLSLINKRFYHPVVAVTEGFSLMDTTVHNRAQQFKEG